MSNSEIRRRDNRAEQAANSIIRTGEVSFAKKVILEIMADEAALAAPFPPYTPPPPHRFYLCSALVEKPGAHGHRAGVYYTDNEHAALGMFISEIMVDGWTLVSYDCKPAEIANKILMGDK
jgi:hypothetical protein